ncbi:MAG: collagen-like protein [Ruminococcus sp.]|nr:collagen-like protein [Ruminococcus sp.]MDE7137878.1 collagen-like protein [Ruminococcus sp.]
MWKFLVKQQKIEILEREVIADQQISFVNMKFVFDGDWKKFHKVVQFTQCDETYNRVLGTDGTSCLLPSELHAGAVKMSVFGYDADNINGLRATTVPVTLNVRPSGFVGDGTEEVPPTPDLYTQLLQKLEEKASSLQNGKDGENGLSAYEIAQNNGFEGTLTEWLASLKGDKGDTGKQGVKGDKGDKGDTGLQGIQGEKGDKGNTGAKGSKGDTGEDGKSAYDVWLAQGNSGTETDFLNSLKGEKGDTGSASVEIEEIETRVTSLEKTVQTHTDDLRDTHIEINNRVAVLSASLSAVDDEQWQHINSLEETSHTHENMDYLDNLIPTISSMSAKLFAIEDEHGKKIETLSGASHTHENKDYLDNLIPTISSVNAKLFAIEDEHGKRIERLETSLEDIKILLADVVEVTE